MKAFFLWVNVGENSLTSQYLNGILSWNPLSNTSQEVLADFEDTGDTSSQSPNCSPKKSKKSGSLQLNMTLGLQLFQGSLWIFDVWTKSSMRICVFFLMINPMMEIIFKKKPHSFNKTKGYDEECLPSHPFLLSCQGTNCFWHLGSWELPNSRRVRWATKNNHPVTLDLWADSLSLEKWLEFHPLHQSTKTGAPVFLHKWIAWKVGQNAKNKSQL